MPRHSKQLAIQFKKQQFATKTKLAVIIFAKLVHEREVNAKQQNIKPQKGCSQMTLRPCAVKGKGRAFVLFSIILDM